MNRQTEVMAILTELLAHDTTKFDAAKRIAALYGTEAQPEPAPFDKTEFYHWVDSTAKGVVHVYHASDCEGGEDCRLFQYLSQGDTMEQHLKRGHEYTVTQDVSGSFIFKQSGKINNKEHVQGSLL